MADKTVPSVRVRNRGQVTTQLDMYATAYREAHPDREVRYVFDPSGKPDISQVTVREASGYELVTYSELGMKETRSKRDPTAIVRVGDLVLMSITKVEKQELVEERLQYAKDQRDTVKREYYETQEKLAQANTKENYSRPSMSPIGTVEIRDKTFEYDIEQRKE